MEEDKTEVDGFPFQRNLCVDGQIKDLSLTVGQCRVLCSFAVIGEQRDFKGPLCFFVPFINLCMVQPAITDYKQRVKRVAFWILMITRSLSILTGIFLCFRQQQADNLTWQQDVDVSQGKPSNS